MKISNEQAEYLLKLPKKIIVEEQLQDNIILNQKFPFCKRFELVSEEDDEFTFLWEFQQSKKNKIRISFHCQDNDSKIGLVRLDYNSGHLNPMDINEFVPAKFHPFAGKYFTNNEHHIHYYVQSYKSLAWAIPLVEDEFEVKELNEGSDFNNNFAKIISLFAKTLNIETSIIINGQLL